ncbi:MAG: hypothetical protein FJX77_06495 [Armatimonadetes bacterium]|nr:hypothetical protein [Armatimonadota bacterium]
MSNVTPIYRIIDSLPTGDLTVRALQALDWIAPGQWRNTVGFDRLIREVTGETDPQLLYQVRERAVSLYLDPNQGYQRAMWLYQTVDRTDQALGAAALANQVGGKIPLLGGFLSRITPRADSAQKLDLSLKLVVEVLAFCQVNGLPGDSLGDFVQALGAYERESLIRMAALVCFDGVLPLGPDLASAVLSHLQRMTPGELEGNGTFQQIRQFIPGGNPLGQLGFLGSTIQSVSGWMGHFIAQHGLTPERIGQSLGSFLQGADERLDIAAGFLDVATAYFSHTGAQSLGRSLISRALAEI